MLCLNVCVSNSDPIIVANHYLKCIETHKFCPRILRMDKGNENIYCEDLQVFFTGKKEFHTFKIHQKPTIEAFWSRLKKFKLTWWIEYFKSMEKEML